jgi:sarcosine oxidase
MRPDFEVAVIGLGGLGSAAAYWAARRFGAGVVGIEQFELGHGRGASEDRSRIIRYSYHRLDYVKLAFEAFGTWRQIEAEAGEELVVTCGGLDFFPDGGVVPIAQYTDAMERAGVPFENLTARVARERWPQFRIPADCSVLFQESSGLVRADAANRSHRVLAVAAGALLLENSPVTEIIPLKDRYRMSAGDRTLTADRLVITADAWTNPLIANFGIALNLEVRREEVSFYESPWDWEAPRMPVWIWMDAPGFYGLPSVGGSGAKIGWDVGGPLVDPDSRTFDPDPAYQRGLDSFMRGLLPGVGRRVEAKTCLYTLTPDREFVIDHVPGHEKVALALGAAHAFKFASVIGRTLVQLVTDGRATVDTSGWSVHRPVMTMADPPRHYTV